LAVDPAGRGGDREGCLRAVGTRTAEHLERASRTQSERAPADGEKVGKAARSRVYEEGRPGREVQVAGDVDRPDAVARAPYAPVADRPRAGKRTGGGPH